MFCIRAWWCVCVCLVVARKRRERGRRERETAKAELGTQRLTGQMKVGIGRLLSQLLSGLEIGGRAGGHGGKGAAIGPKCRPELMRDCFLGRDNPWRRPRSSTLSPLRSTPSLAPWPGSQARGSSSSRIGAAINLGNGGRDQTQRVQRGPCWPPRSVSFSSLPQPGTAATRVIPTARRERDPVSFAVQQRSTACPLCGVMFPAPPA